MFYITTTTTAPTFATPTGRAAGFPRTVYIFANK